ncbi:MAG: Gfo/Idh/MocA family protein [Armatimonadota bacterium]
MAQNVGILGCAHAHVQAYCGRWREHPEWGVHPAVVWDRDEARAVEVGKTFAMEVAPSADALLAREDIAAVVIAAETSFHADLVEQAAAAGKAIIVQKPLALTLEEAERIVAAVGCAGVPFTLAWQMRVDPHNLRIKSLLEGGQFGRLYMLRRRHTLNSHLWPGFEKSWHVQPKLNRDLFADDAAHPIDFIYWMLGMPASVTAELGTLHNPAVVNDNGIVIFRYADGTFAEVSVTFVAVAGELITEAVCEKGTIVHNFGDVPSTNNPWPPGGIQLKWFLQEAGTWAISDLPEIKSHGERIAGLAQPLAEFLRGERPPIATAEEGRDVLRLVLACYDAHAQGRRINL